MINYYKSYIDNNGFVHSIDMVKIFYDCGEKYNNILKAFQLLNVKHHLGSLYWEKLDCLPCSKWSFWVHHIHLDYIYIKLGCYKQKSKDINDKSFVVMNCMCLEVNPNKHYDKELFKDVLKIIGDVRYQGFILQVDYAIDIPCNIQDVIVLKSRKEQGLYKGTRYYGSRGRNGFVKIYNKAKESELTSPLTRVETNVVLKEKYSSIDFGVIKHNDNNDNGKELSLSTGLILNMLQELKMLGSNNVEEYLNRMNYRTRKQIIEAMNNDIIEYQYNAEYLNQLIEDMNKLFKCDDYFTDSENDDISNYGDVEVDEQGFLVVDDSELPWEL